MFHSYGNDQNPESEQLQALETQDALIISHSLIYETVLPISRETEILARMIISTPHLHIYRRNTFELFFLTS
jgi:hypothetical protein